MKSKRAKKRIQEFLNSIDWLFQVNNFDKVINFKDKDEDSVRSNKQAEIIYWEEYQQLTINIFPSFFEHNLIVQRKMLLHELAHTITLPSKEAMQAMLDGKIITPDRIREINEMATSKIENILDGLLREKLRCAVRAYKSYLK